MPSECIASIRSSGSLRDQMLYCVPSSLRVLRTFNDVNTERRENTQKRKINLSDTVENVKRIVLDATFGFTFLDSRNSHLQQLSRQVASARKPNVTK